MDEESIFEYNYYISTAGACKKRAEDYEDTYEFLRAKMKYEEAAAIYDRALEVAWSNYDVNRAGVAEGGRDECVYQASDMLRRHIESLVETVI